MSSPEFLQNLQRVIDLLLRNVVSGGAAIIAFAMLEPISFSFFFEGTGETVSVWLVLLFVFSVGPGIYAIHKALLHPILLCFIHFGIRISHKKVCPEASKLNVRQLDIRLSDTLNNWKHISDPWVPYYESWASQVHFLYGTTWGIFGAYLLAKKVYPEAVNLNTSLIFTCIFLLCALISDIRLTNRQFERTFLVSRKNGSDI